RSDILTAPRGVRATVDHDVDTGRSFTTDELQRIFDLPLFRGCRGELEPNGLFKPGNVQIRDDRFWIPLVLLFTGARSSEIAGLATADVQADDEVPHFIIRPNNLRGLKTSKSARLVPVHPTLRQIGFLDFARARVAADPDGKLFPLVEELNYRSRRT